MAHVMKKSQKNKTDGYYLGAVVLDQHDGVTYLVDGQQRFTTMYVMSCAVRDALIATGWTDEGHKLHHNIIINTDKINNGRIRNRYELLDIPPSDDRSSEYQLAPYRKRLVNIPTGLRVDEGGRSGLKSKSLAIKGGKMKWTVESGEKWYFRLWDEDKSAFVGSVYRVTDDDNNNLKYGQNTPRKLILDLGFNNGNFDRMDVFREDLEIVLITDVKWAGREIIMDAYAGHPPLGILSDSARKRSMNLSEDCDLFSPRNREFYLSVRNTAEHFIREYKTFSPAGGIKKSQNSTTLHLRRSGPEGEIGQSSRNLGKGEVLEFEEKNESADWPTDSQLIQIIEKDESSFVEFKQGFKISRFNPKTGKTESTKMMIEMAVKAVASFLNTRGGLLLVGVGDGGRIVGINDEGYIDKHTKQWSNDRAIQYFADRVRSYIGRSASKFVEYRVYTLNNEKVMCVKVEKYPEPVNVEITTKWNSDTGERLKPASREYFTKDAVSSLKMQDHDAEEYKGVAQYLSSQLGQDYKKGNDSVIKHKFEISDFSGISPWRKSSSIQTKVPTASGSIITEYDIPADAVCKIPYLEPGKKWDSHLDMEKKRARELRNLIEHTCFTKVLFNKDPLSAIDHFMLTNNPDKFEPLNAYDLTSSFTEKLMEKEDGNDLNEYQQTIRQKWYRLRHELYIEADKESKQINKFFSDFLLAELLTKGGGSQRFKEKETWTGVEEEFKKRTLDSGKYDYEGMAKLYTNMEGYMISYLRAINDNSVFWNEKPYNQSSCRDERNYLQAIKIAGVKQHIPPYIALVKEVERQSADRAVIRDFLKNFNYVWLRFITLPALMKTEYGKGFQPNQVYGKHLGSNGWIPRIKAADMNDESDRNMIASMPLEMIPDSDTVDVHYPWIKDHDDWGDINLDGTPSGVQIKHLLYSAERALEFNDQSNQNPQMTRLHGVGVKVQTEHIIPRSSRQLGGKWYADGETTEYHSKYVYALGNHCLIEDSKNSSIRNKPPTEKASAYLGSDFKLAKIVGDEITNSGTWDKTEIMRNSNRIMNSLVDFYS